MKKEPLNFLDKAGIGVLIVLAAVAAGVMVVRWVASIV